ncbi:hypothetical protein GFY24_22460 [Nocardia sp. SYP-A9097]|uniref:hypothetical protein n=1 Tax=Nocardia sp. SYP-A9097 TaxID=2663237 RepID=UPI00129BBA6A|nr:hypothetical protein [Nocardia sp. SYP-A9097]MRH90169.1 hypothetical protein [Nocardia sp. SYP-A9097]
MLIEGAKTNCFESYNDPASRKNRPASAMVDVAGVEFRGKVATAVARYLEMNRLSGPQLVVPGAGNLIIHLAVGANRAPSAVAYLQGYAANIHYDLLAFGPDDGWVARPGIRDWIPPIVLLAAATRAVLLAP